MNSSQEFLKHCAQDIIAKRFSKFSSTTIVFPNKRPILFFKKHLAQEIDTPIFAPQFTTIQDLFAHTNKSIIPEPIVLIYELYVVYKKHTESLESFDDFYPWGNMLLQDFNDIDTYLIDAQQLFSNIASIKEFESTFDFLTEEQIEHIQRFWDILSTRNDTKAKISFLEIWNVLARIFTEFKQRLANKDYAYHGMSARNTIEQAKQGECIINEDIHYIFIGFNALNTCETELFSYLQNKKQTSFYWDYDSHYLNSEFNHEAGYFIKKNIAKFPNELPESFFNNLAQHKEISILSAPNNISQIKQCHSWIKSISQDSLQTSESAIILADEQLLVPLMHSIPDDINYNISLGYPIKNTLSFALFLALLELQQNKKDKSFFYKNVTQICESPLLSETHKSNALELRKRLHSKNFVYVSEKYIQKEFQIEPYFTSIDKPVEFISHLEKCIMLTGENPQVSDIEKSVLFAIHQELQQLKLLIQEHQIPIESVSFISSLLKKSLVSKNIPIQGEPLQGLQIMGILETRTLDFKNLIILSMNEGLFPRTSVGSSFIPYSIRTGFGMPTIKEQTAIYSYYFYRLIQRAQKVTLAYSAQVDENSKGELSRYIMQLKYDTPSGIKKLKESELTFSISPQKKSGITIQKEDETIERFFKYTEEKPLSPSALDSYITCSLKYYFRYVRKLYKLDEVKEIPDEADFGNFFHYSLEDLYKNFENKEINKTDIEKILQNDALIHKTVDANIKKVLSENNNTTTANEGNRALAHNTVVTYIKNTLTFDKNKAPFLYLHLQFYV